MTDPLIKPLFINGLCRKCWHCAGDHTDSLSCRVCKNPCGIDCSGMFGFEDPAVWPDTPPDPLDLGETT